MKNKLETVAVIRQRGQLTIPDEIREGYPWLESRSVVTVTPQSAEEIVIRPFKATGWGKTDWDKIWREINKVRSFKGRGRVGSLSEFLVRDRETHF